MVGKVVEGGEWRQRRAFIARVRCTVSSAHGRGKEAIGGLGGFAGGAGVLQWPSRGEKREEIRERSDAMARDSRIGHWSAQRDALCLERQMGGEEGKEEREEGRGVNDRHRDVQGHAGREDWQRGAERNMSGRGAQPAGHALEGSSAVLRLQGKRKGAAGGGARRQRGVSRGARARRRGQAIGTKGRCWQLGAACDVAERAQLSCCVAAEEGGRSRGARVNEEGSMAWQEARGRAATVGSSD